MKHITISVLVFFTSLLAWADRVNPNNITIQLLDGQTAQLTWLNSPIMSGVDAQNSFILKVGNSAAGFDTQGELVQPEDLKGITAGTSQNCVDFFKFEMTDMNMPDPATVFKQPRKITRTGVGTYQVTEVLFSMSSMQGADWQIDIIINGTELGSGRVEVQ